MNNSNWPETAQESGEILLRPAQPADADEYIRIVTASSSFLHPWVDPPDDPTKFNALIEQSTQAEFLPVLVCLCSDQRIIGNINISQIAYGNFCSAYLGFWIAQEFAGRGLMTAALQKLVTVAFQEMKLHRLEANIQPANTSSKKLVARAGFRQEGHSLHYLKIEGTWQDHDRYAITAEDLFSEDHPIADRLGRR